MLLSAKNVSCDLTAMGKKLLQYKVNNNARLEIQNSF